jgi:signal transduction histidine kinase/ligand-binding sensor domain-containing protein/DNA-binding NarL/FixJ family response regulator
MVIHGKYSDKKRIFLSEIIAPKRASNVYLLLAETPDKQSSACEPRIVRATSLRKVDERDDSHSNRDDGWLIMQRVTHDRRIRGACLQIGAASLALTLVLFCPLHVSSTIEPIAPAARLTPGPAPRIDVADAGRPAMRVFTSREGLPANAIQAIERDARGYLWVATQDGLASHNGRVWTITNLPNRTVSNFVRALLVDSSGALWCGRENGGIARLHEGGWSTFDTNDGLPSDRVHCLLELGRAGASELWAGTQKGLARFERGAWRTEAAETFEGATVRCLLVTKSAGGIETLWAGTSRGLFARASEKWARVDFGDVAATSVNAILEVSEKDGSSALWVGTDRGLLVSRGGIWQAPPDTGSSPTDSVGCLIATTGVDRETTVWAGTEATGLHRFARNRWTHIGSREGLPSDSVWSLYPVPGANGTSLLWVGTDAGLVRFGLGGWTTYDSKLGLPGESVYGLLVTKDEAGDESVWIGTRGAGLAHYERGAWTTYTDKEGLPGNSVWTLVEVPGADGTMEVWAGTTGTGLARFVRGRWSVFGEAQGFKGEGIRNISVSASPSGRPILWASSGNNGLHRIEDGRVTVLDRSSGLPTDSVFCALETISPDGQRTLWVGTQGGGLARRRGDSWAVFDSGNGLPNDSVLSLCEVTFPGGRKSLWAGTEGGGVARLDLGAQGDAEPTWVVLDDAGTPPIPNNTVYQIRQDANGSIYLFTNQGVARLTARQPTPDDPAEFQLVRYTTEDGLPINEFNGGASALDYRGRIWGGTVGGAVMFDPAREVEPAPSKPLLFERREVMGSGRSLADGEALAHDVNGLTFEFAYVTFEHAIDVTYRTQLVGLDREPSPWIPDAKKEYTTLPRGDYVFRVWARDHRGDVVGPIEAPFSVRPAPWLTVWAFMLYALLLAIGIYAVVRLRVRALDARNALLETRIAEKTADLAATVDRLKVSERSAHEAREAALDASRAKSTFLSNMSHELRTPLNALLGFAQLMDREPHRSRDDRESLEVIQRSGEHLLGLINDVLSLSKIEAGRLTLNEQSFDLVRLLRSVEEMVRVRADAKSLQLVLEIVGDLPPVVVGDEGKLRQILINLLGNAVKFTEHGGVALRAGWSDGRATFEVEDTGPGIAPEEIRTLFEAFVQTQTGRQAREGTGLGLAISRSFAQHMGGDIRVRSELGRGTVFTLEVELPEGVATAPVESERRIVGLAHGQEPFRILVADDKWENRVLLEKLLTTVGFEVQHAATGLEAVDRWREWSPHLIFMDLRMPMLDGSEATRAIRASDTNEPPTKIVALTASAFEHERENVLASGCDEFLTKPFLVATIFDTLALHLGVRYLYAGGTDVAPPAALVVTQERLRALPVDALASLGHALAIGNITAAIGVVEENQERDPELARELGRIIRSYAYDELLELVEGTSR